MRKILDSKTIAKVAAAKAKGFTTKEIAERFGISVGSVVNAGKIRSEKQTLKSSAQSEVVTTTAPSEHPELAVDADPPTPDELRRWMGAQVRALKDECDSAKERGDNAAFASLSRLLASTGQTLARLTPEETKTDDHPDWDAAAANCRDRMKDAMAKAMTARTDALTSRDPQQIAAAFGPLSKNVLRKQIEDLNTLMEFAQ